MSRNLRRSLSVSLLSATAVAWLGLSISGDALGQDTDRPARLSVWVRPCPERLARMIREDGGMTNDETRDALAAGIRRIDRAHAAGLLAVSECLASPADCEEYVRSRTKDLHPRTPLPERAVLLGLRLQVEPLHRLLLARDAERAGRLERARKNRSVRILRHSIFGDVRDVLLAATLASLEPIAKLQKALGHDPRAELAFPAHLEGEDQVREYLVAALDRLGLAAEKIRDRTLAEGGDLPAECLRSAAEAVWRIDAAHVRRIGKPAPTDPPALISPPLAPPANLGRPGTSLLGAFEREVCFLEREIARRGKDAPPREERGKGLARRLRGVCRRIAALQEVLGAQLAEIPDFADPHRPAAERLRDLSLALEALEGNAELIR